MSIDIAPAVLAEDVQAFRQKMERIASFATRVHIDLTDGSMTPTSTVAANDVWWPGGMQADLHVMYKRPMQHIRAFVALQPQVVIVHAEAEGDFITFAKTLQSHGIEAGIAILPSTELETIKPGLEYIDHVLIFSGDLGHYGGIANLQLLERVKAIRALKPTVEIGWDGGVNDQNAHQIAATGVDVLSVGGFIQNAKDPQAAYNVLGQKIR